MTSSARGPEYPVAASARRIELTRRVTAQSLRAQAGDWTWIVYVNREDPLLEDRVAAFAHAGRPVLAVEGNDEAEAAIDWSGPVLTTRIDDDDAFAADAFSRLYDALAPVAPVNPTAYIFPDGYHVRDGRIERNRHFRNAWASVYSPLGFREHVRKHQHQRIPGAYPTVYLEIGPAWLRVSHPDNTRPTSARPHSAITAPVRALFPDRKSVV